MAKKQTSKKFKCRFIIQSTDSIKSNNLPSVVLNLNVVLAVYIDFVRLLNLVYVVL